MESQEEQKREKNSQPSLKDEISELKGKLEGLEKNKEEWFKKKEDLKGDIAKLISEIREVRKKKEELVQKVKPLKENRDKYNSEVKTLIEELKKQKKEGDERRAKFGDATPESLKRKIESLEQSLETNVVSFEKEKQIMKEINSLKKKLDALKDYQNVDFKDLSKRIEEAKTKADEFHAELQICLKENKELSKNFSRISKEINTLKKVQEEAFANFIKFKQEFLDVNKLLKDKQEMQKGEVERKRRTDSDHRKKEKIKEEEKITEELKKKAGEVEAKLKSKKVLTTEDLLAFQGMKE